MLLIDRVLRFQYFLYWYIRASPLSTQIHRASWKVRTTLNKFIMSFDAKNARDNLNDKVTIRDIRDNVRHAQNWPFLPPAFFRAGLAGSLNADPVLSASMRPSNTPSWSSSAVKKQKMSSHAMPSEEKHAMRQLWNGDWHSFPIILALLDKNYHNLSTNPHSCPQLVFVWIFHPPVASFFLFPFPVSEKRNLDCLGNTAISTNLLLTLSRIK